MPPKDSSTYDLVVVGSSFASAFFLHGYLRHAPSTARVLVLERGTRREHEWMVKNRSALNRASTKTWLNETPQKPWRFTVAYGGSSNCWVGCTPRMLPEDFELKTRYGVGADWPISYEELEPYYLEAEQLMSISGPDNTALFPRSGPYPEPPHRMHKPDERLAKAYPGLYFTMPTARSRLGNAQRGACCANHVCQKCPLDAKFTILNGFREVFADPRVTLRLRARVDSLETKAGAVVGVHYALDGLPQRVACDFVALGANAIFNPVLLMKSGLTTGPVGKGLVEQVSLSVDVMLDGLDSFQGSTYLTGHGYMLYGGEHRAHHAAGLIETKNRPDLRMERGRWRQRLKLKVIYEDLRQDKNQVAVNQDPWKPAKVTFRGRSDYAKRALRRCQADLERVLAPLPVESITVARRPEGTEAHVMGTTVMGNDTNASVVDANLLHHRARNVAVLGSGVFPTAAPANPTLTLSALSLRSANILFGATR